MNPEVKEVIEKALSGERISAKEALLLMRLEGDDVLALGVAANTVRERAVGNAVTYIVNRNVNFTNVCVGSCKFCAFRRSKGDKDAYLLEIRQVVNKAKEAKNVGATELCVQGGLNPDVDIDYYVDIIRAVKEEVGMDLHAFSPMEIAYMSQGNGQDTRDVLKTLKKAGLGSIPGTAAEILVDRVREEICPEKISADEWARIIKEAHREGIPTTATMLYGHVESPEEQIKHLSILRDIQDETDGFTEFVPLSFVHFNAPLFLSGNGRSGASGIEDLLLFSVSRLFLDNFKNIQSSWVKLGRKLSQVLLLFGANDLGGTLMEEHISRSAGIESKMVTEKELERMIVSAGRVPIKRDTTYSHQ